MRDYTEKNTPQYYAVKSEISPHKHWTIWHFGAATGFLGGFLIVFVAGLVFIFKSFLNETFDYDWLFFAVLPLWIFGAHCIDEIEKSEKAKRFETAAQPGCSSK